MQILHSRDYVLTAQSKATYASLMACFAYAGLTAMQPATSAAATRLDSVPDGVKEVMLAMQQMASVAVQMNAARDPCHNDLLQSLSPDALLACGKAFHKKADIPILLMFCLQGCATRAAACLLSWLSVLHVF